MASLLNDSVKWSLSRALHDSQRGFVIQRNFLNNVLDLDTEARLASRLPPRGGGFFVRVNRKWKRVAEVAVSGQDIALADVIDMGLIGDVVIRNEHGSMCVCVCVCAMSLCRASGTSQLPF